MKTIQSLVIALAFMLGAIISLNAQSVNVEKSVLKWKGEKVTGEHYGKISLQSGNLTVSDGMIKSGSFVINMKSIICDDLEDATYNQKLVNHLKSDDFFGVETHPVAKLAITGSSKFADNKATVKADLTIKGITHPVTFVAEKTKNGYTAIIKVDRSKYDVRYGSKSFFDDLGDKVIYDEFTLDVTLVLE